MTNIILLLKQSFYFKMARLRLR